MTMNLRLQNSEKGLHLSQRKADALKMRFALIVEKLVMTKNQLKENFQDYQISLTAARFVSGSLDYVTQNVSKAQVKVFLRMENVAGVHLPSYELFKVDADPNKHIGLVSHSPPA